MALVWTITIEGRNEFGDVCRKQIQVDTSWERLRDGEIGLSIDDGKKIMKVLQSAVVQQEIGTERAKWLVWSDSGSKNVKLFCQAWSRIEGEPRLSFAHHVDHLDPIQRGGRACKCLEAKHWPYATLDTPMVLILIGFNGCRERSCKRFAASQEMIAS